MDCAAITNLLNRMGCHLNNTLVDEMVGLGFLFLVCIAGLFIIGMAFVDGVIKPWRNGKAHHAAPLDADATNTEEV